MTTDVASRLQKYVRSLGVADDFVERVAQDAEQQIDDWMLVVKLHALLESALIERMQAQMGLGEASQGFIVSLDMRRRAIYLRLYDVITEADVTFIKGFGDLRNRFVHAARHTEHALITDKFANDSKFHDAEKCLRGVCEPRLANTQIGARNLTPKESGKSFQNGPYGFTCRI